MALNKKIFPKVAVAGNGGAAASAEQNLILNLDANDVDSYDGDGSIWYDISEHDVTIPLSDNADDLELHLNASDSTSYDGSGTTWTDISGNSRNGTINGSPPYDIDRYGSFDFTQNTGDYIEITTNSALQPASTGTTYEFWITPDTSSDTNTLLYYGTTDGYGLMLFNNYGTPYVVAYNSSNGAVVNFSSGYSISNNTLAHVVFTFSSDVNPVVNIYVDGEFKQTSTGSGTIRKDSAVNIVLGRYTLGNLNDFEGKMHAARIYSKVLSASEIAQNYRHGVDYIYTDLVDDTNLELHLDAGNTDSYDPSSDGSTWSDLTTNGHNATLTSMDANQHDQEIGGWFEFDGTNDYMTVTGNSAFYPTTTTGITVECWFTSDTTDDGETLVHTRSGTGGWRLFSSYSNLYVDTFNSSDGLIGRANAGTVSDDTWHHAVFTLENSNSTATLKLYLDGELIDTASLSDTMGTTVSDLAIGGRTDRTFDKLDGKIGQVRIYSEELSADEVMQNYLFTKNNYPNVYHATAVNSPTFSSSYFDFDDTNNTSTDYFSLSNDVLQVLSGKEGMSISAWVNFDTVSGNQSIISTYEGGSTLLFGFNTTNAKFTWYLYDSNFEGSRSSVDVFSTGVWTHIVAVFDGSQTHASGTGGKYQAYIDGSEITMNTLYTGPNLTEVPSVASNVPLRIAAGFGSGSIGEDSFDGKISKIRIYDRAITSAEVTAIFNEGSGN